MISRPDSPPALPSRRARGARLQCTALLLFSLAQLLLGAHHAFEEHTTCPIDGQLAHGVHAGHGHDVACHAASPSATPRSDERDGAPGELPVAVGEEREGEHADHCSFPLCREPRILDGRRPPTLEGLPSSPSAPRALASLVHGTRVALFRLAPKNSPPGTAPPRSTELRRAT